jgi:O-antigen/teichoic acid export membrane protein
VTLNGGSAGLLRRVIGLSAGTTIARGLSAVSQLALAFWLTPTEFGYWAAASSALTLLTGLANFGEVNGYLAGRNGTLSSTRRRVFALNGILVAAGLTVALVYYLNGAPEVAILAAIAAITIPLAGDSDLHYAAGVKFHVNRRVIVAQVTASAVKLVVGIAIAMLLHSALALAISMVTFYLTADIMLIGIVTRLSKLADNPSGNVPVKHRISWAINSLAMSLPLQIGFLVAQFLASPHLLGVFFFAFQVTLGISGLIAAPLARVSLSALGEARAEHRLDIAVKLSGVFGAGMLAVSAMIAMVLPLAAPFVSVQWVAAVPAIIGLVASLPTRIISPIMDAYQQSQNSWWQSTFFNLLAAAGMGAAALTSATGNIRILVLAVSGWLVIHGMARTWYVLRDASFAARMQLTLGVGSGAALISAAAATESIALSVSLSGIALVIGVAWGAHIIIKARRTR